LLRVLEAYAHDTLNLMLLLLL